MPSYTYTGTERQKELLTTVAVSPERREEQNPQPSPDEGVRGKTGLGARAHTPLCSGPASASALLSYLESD